MRRPLFFVLLCLDKIRMASLLLLVAGSALGSSENSTHNDTGENSTHNDAGLRYSAHNNAVLTASAYATVDLCKAADTSGNCTIGSISFSCSCDVREFVDEVNTRRCDTDSLTHSHTNIPRTPIPTPHPVPTRQISTLGEMLARSKKDGIYLYFAAWMHRASCPRIRIPHRRSVYDTCDPPHPRYSFLSTGTCRRGGARKGSEWGEKLLQKEPSNTFLIAPPLSLSLSPPPPP